MRHQAIVLAAVAMMGTATAQAATSVQRVIPYQQDNEVSDAIKAECQLGEKLAGFVQEYAAGEVVLQDALDTSNGRALQLEIIDSGNMGNAFTGRQTYTRIRGTLFQDGQQVATFKARRNSMGGAFAGFKGACSVLGRTVKTLGKDVAGWLQDPRDGASLGD